MKVNVILISFLFIGGTLLHSLTPEEKAWIQKGIELARKGEYEKAISLFKKAAAKGDSSTAMAYYNMGYTYELAGKHDKAIIHYKKALDRNPELVMAMQNLGYLLFLEGEYKQAIYYGEKTMKLDPENQKVPKWLPKAYEMAAQQRIYALQNQKKTPQNKKKEAQKAVQPNNPYPSEAGYTITVPYRYEKSRATFVLHKQAPPLVIPMYLYANLKPSPSFEMKIQIGEGFLGIVHPIFIAGHQKTEFFYRKKHLKFGLGVNTMQINMQKSEIPAKSDTYVQNTKVKTISDTKYGLLFGYENKDTKFLIYAYPRYLIKDASPGFQSTQFDLTSLGLIYRWKGSFFGKELEKKGWPYFLSFSLLSDEIYVTEYEAGGTTNTIGHYFGTFAIRFGLEFGRLVPKFNKTSVAFGFEYTLSLYFQDLNDSNPDKFGNGQGYLGFDSAGAVSGNAFPSFYTNGQRFTFYLKELYFRRLVAKQLLGFEIMGSAKVNGLYLGLGFGYRF
ncbi:MAG: tetratricopeptide repeat protein [Candidatus Hydrogenedentota bacterium]|nr:MAG: tetratricopeptide repeat protein [Candidatus Hydrogenedentota bacterium]